MKNLINKIFKKEPQFNYIIAEYQPNKIQALESSIKITEYEVDGQLEHDEMEIDKIYQNV
jgi:hypothetical protein